MRPFGAEVSYNRLPNLVFITSGIAPCCRPERFS